MADGSRAILHVLRAPIGGLFRHVLDLAEGQAARGHRVGIVAASATASNAAEERLATLTQRLVLGVHRLPMQRHPGVGDLSALREVARQVRRLRPDVLHGHGAKGGAFVRLVPRANAVRVYTPHGGTLHYGRTAAGLVYGLIERALIPRTELFLFESEFAQRAYTTMIGAPRGLARVVHNGVSANEMTPVEPAADAADLVYVGELRHIKGPDVLIAALALLRQRGRRVTAVLAGDGPDRAGIEAAVDAAGLAGQIQFIGYTPARLAFARGRILVVPSRAESLPYIVLEAAAAGLPVIATNVGGIPEIVGTTATLVPPGDAAALADAIAQALDRPDERKSGAQDLRSRIATRFSQDAMVDAVLGAYADAEGLKFQRPD